jgi:hypothetical protein
LLYIVFSNIRKMILPLMILPKSDPHRAGSVGGMIRSVPHFKILGRPRMALS